MTTNRLDWYDAASMFVEQTLLPIFVAKELAALNPRTREERIEWIYATNAVKFCKATISGIRNKNSQSVHLLHTIVEFAANQSDTVAVEYSRLLRKMLDVLIKC